MTTLIRVHSHKDEKFRQRASERKNESETAEGKKKNSTNFHFMDHKICAA